MPRAALRMLACLAAVVLALAAGCSADSGPPPPPYASAYHKPLVLPNTGADTADPHCILFQGTWYLYATSSQKNLEVWTSTDLLTWSYGGVVWQPTPGTWNNLSSTGVYGAWAPSVHQGDDGAFYLYYTAALRVGVARAATPLGPFAEVLDHPLLGDGHGGVGDGVLVGTGRVDLPNDFQEFAIDPFVLRTSTGARYLYAAIYTPISVIAAWPMTDMSTLAASTPTIVGTPNSSWEGGVMEGPFVVEEGGKFLLTYSGNRYTSVSYGLGVAVADDPLGPFTKDDNNPFFATMDARGIWGPGHHSFVDGGHGNTLIFYHSKASPDPGANRQIRFGPVTFGGAAPVTVQFPG